MKFSLLLSALLHTALLAGWPVPVNPPHHTGHNAIITLALNPVRASVRTVAALPTGSVATGRASKKRYTPTGKIHKTAAAQAPRRAQWHTHRRNKPSKAASTVASQAKTVLAHHTAQPIIANTTTRQVQAPVDIATLSRINPPITGPKGKNRERPAHQGNGASIRRLQSTLRHALAPYFHYPLLARRRGWEGIVKLGMHIDAAGRLSQIRIVRSSGYALLDKAAKSSLRRVIAIPHSSQKGLDMVLPVKYRLVNS